MARKKSPSLTEGELRLMEVVWEKGAATVAEVAEALPRQLGLAYNTVLTTLRILEDKGYVRRMAYESCTGKGVVCKANASTIG